MTALHLTPGKLFGGVEAYLLAVADRDRDAAFGLTHRGRLLAELTAAGATVHHLGEVRLSRPWTVLAARRRLRAALPGVAAVVCHGCWAHAAFGPAVRGTRLIHAAHGAAGGWLERLAARTRPAVVVANSRFTAGSVAATFPGVPARVAYPVSRGVVNPPPRRVRDRGPVVILTAARLEPGKGHATLINALSRLRAVPGWVAKVVGGPRQAAAVLQRQAERAGLADRVTVLGERDDVPHSLADADIYCQPNVSPEGFGLAFAEALAAGVPVVTSRLGGAVEVVTERCGILTPPGDAAAVADALHGLIRDPDRRRELGMAGPARVAEVCDPDALRAALWA